MNLTASIPLIPALFLSCVLCAGDVICAVDNSAVDLFPLIQKSAARLRTSIPKEQRPNRLKIEMFPKEKLQELRATPPADTDLLIVSTIETPDASDFAIQGILFAVPKSNPVREIPESAARRAINSGIVRWNDNGKLTSAVIYRKAPKFTNQSPMEAKTLEKKIEDKWTPPEMPWIGDAQKKPVEKPKPQVVFTETDEAALSFASADPNGLALLPVSMLFQKTMKLLEVNGTAPDIENLLCGKYLFSKRYYLSLTNPNRDSFTGRLYLYLISDAFAQQMLASGLFPLTGTTPITKTP